MILGIVAGALRQMQAVDDPYFADVLLLMDATDRANGSAGIVDFSSFARVLTAVNNATILSERFEFDGTNDWITAPDSADWQFLSGTLNFDFTVEIFGVTFDALGVDTNGNAQMLISHYDAFSPATNQRGWYLTSGAVNLAAAASSNGTSASTTASLAWTPVIGQEYDIALVRQGSGWLLFIDGALVATGSNALNLFNSSSPLAVGGRNTQSSTAADSDDLDGRIRAVRVTRAARYVDDYEVPTLPLTKQPPSVQDGFYNSVISLLDFDGADGATNIRDLLGKIWTVNGNAQLDTAQVRFGHASLLLDGSGDYISTPNVVGHFSCATDFTVEAWIYRTESDVNNRDVICSKYVTFASDGFTFQIFTGGLLNFALGGSGGFQSVSSVAQVPLNTWTHVAAAKQGSTIRLFINGVLDGTLAVSGTPGVNTAEVRIGRDAIDLTRDFNGNIDDFRWTQGVARYTATFTPPDAALPRFVDETFNTADIGPGLTFTNGNKTISRNIGGNDSPNYANASRSKRRRSTGRVYFEATMGRDGSQWSGLFGIMRASQALTSTTPTPDGDAGVAANLINIYPSGGGGITTMRVRNQSLTAVNYTPEAANNSVSGVAIDFDAGKIWFRNSGNWLLGSLAGGAAGASFDEDDPTFTFTPGDEWKIYGESPFSSTAITLNIGPTFANTPPNGFGYW